jgi:RimJ/RimL family protein N-acetyltransferase
VSDIRTPRLILRTVPLIVLDATARNDRAVAERQMGGPLSDEWFADAWIFGLRRDQWLEDASYGPWSIRALVRRETGEIIGTINCHRAPAPFRYGDSVFAAVEVGYSVFSGHRRQGFGFEAVSSLMAWAAAQGVGGFILTIAPDNGPSQALARKLAADRIGSQMDEQDGPEDVFLVRV